MSAIDGMNDKSVPKGVELRADTAIQGLQTAMPSKVTDVTVGAVDYKVPDLTTYAQSLVQPWKDARAAHAVLRQFAQDKPAAYQKLIAFLADLKIGMSSVLGRSSEELTKFGFKPQQNRKPLTSAQKAVRAAKAKLTRAQRHTLGTKQKAALGTA